MLPNAFQCGEAGASRAGRSQAGAWERGGFGFFPGFGAAWLYPKALGLPKAMEMLYTGNALSAAEAKEIAMLNHMVSRESLEAEGVTAFRENRPAAFKGI